MSNRRVKQEGNVGAEHIALIVLVGLVGIGGFGLLGSTMHADIANDAAGNGVTVVLQAAAGGGEPEAVVPEAPTAKTVEVIGSQAAAGANSAGDGPYDDVGTQVRGATASDDSEGGHGGGGLWDSLGDALGNAGSLVTDTINTGIRDATNAIRDPIGFARSSLSTLGNLWLTAETGMMSAYDNYVSGAWDKVYEMTTGVVRMTTSFVVDYAVTDMLGDAWNLTVGGGFLHPGTFHSNTLESIHHFVTSIPEYGGCVWHALNDTWHSISVFANPFNGQSLDARAYALGRIAPEFFATIAGVKLGAVAAEAGITGTAVSTGTFSRAVELAYAPMPAVLGLEWATVPSVIDSLGDRHLRYPDEAATFALSPSQDAASTSHAANDGTVDGLTVGMRDLDRMTEVLGEEKAAALLEMIKLTENVGADTRDRISEEDGSEDLLTTKEYRDAMLNVFNAEAQFGHGKQSNDAARARMEESANALRTDYEAVLETK